MPARIFSNYIASLPNDKIIIEERGQGLKIECGELSAQIQGHNPDDFPIIPKISVSHTIEVGGKNFYNGLSMVAGIVSPSQSRPEISGVFVSFSKNILKIAATDSFRLAEKNITMEKAVEKDFSFILPQKPAIEIINFLEGKELPLKIYFSDNQAMFEVPMAEIKHPQIQITTRLIDGEYPNYQDIIPNKFISIITLKKEEFLNKIKTASLFSGKTNEVKFSVNPKEEKIEIYAHNADVGENKAVMAAKIKGEKADISFNYRYLIDGLSLIKSSEIIFSISKEDGPCIIKPVGDESYTYVVMPIKAI